MFLNGYCGPGFMGGPFGAHLIFPVAILALILIFSWLVFGRSEQVVGCRSDSALELLQRRYAAGEIDENEYLLRKENLS